MMSKVAKRAVNAGEIVERRATGLNRFLNDVFDVTHQDLQPFGWCAVLANQTSRLTTR